MYSIEQCPFAMLLQGTSSKNVTQSFVKKKVPHQQCQITRNDTE
jgi:hypothetical protein